jgi:hypothetical protein
LRGLAKAVRGREIICRGRENANKSFTINPRLRNNFLRSQFDPVKFRAIVRFAWILQSFGLT